MGIIQGANVADAIPGDVEVTGILWSGDDDEHVTLRLRAGEWSGRLLCTWAYPVSIDLDQSTHIGVTPCWEHSLSQDGKGRWHLELDLPPTGSISITCQDVQLEMD